MIFIMGEQHRMIDPGTISGGMGAVKGGWAFLQYLRSVLGKEVIGALFSFDGTRLDGSEKIRVELHSDDKKPEVWWYSVEEPEGYSFLREPVVPSSCHELIGTVAGEQNPDARYWRWVAPVLPGRIYGGADAPSVKTNFLVFGYKPGALLRPTKPK
jgi:hypothetical protein